MYRKFVNYKFPLSCVERFVADVSGFAIVMSEKSETQGEITFGLHLGKKDSEHAIGFQSAQGYLSSPCHVCEIETKVIFQGARMKFACCCWEVEFVFYVPQESPKKKVSSLR